MPSQRFLQSLLAFLCFSLIVAGATHKCGAQPALPASSVLSTAEMKALVQVPQNFESLLGNIKKALDHALLLRADFYTDDVLRHYFGGRTVSWSPTDGADKKWGQIGDFGPIVTPITVQGVRTGGLAFYFYKELQPGGTCISTLSLTVSGETTTDFEAVGRILGAGWEHGPIRPLSPDYGYHPRTRPHGNDLIEYSIRDGLVNWQASFEFAPDAMIKNANFTQEGPYMP